MDVTHFDRLLDPSPMPLEMGYQRHANGVLHVAIRTDMHRCSGEMLEWWFRFRPATREYVWWHPLDHIASAWSEVEEDTHIGSIHHVTERFTGSDPEQLAIQFRDPAEFFSESALAALVCAQGGPGPMPRRRTDGTVIGTRLAHICRDTPWGMVLRSHFFMGYDLPGLGMPPAAVEQLFPTAHAPLLLQHCYDEFTTLSRFLPSLHNAEAPNRKPSRPW